MEYNAYAGKILYIDLTTGRSRTEPLDPELARKFIGGCGIGARLLYDLLKPDTNPLSPENPIILSAGLLTGTPAPSSSKIQLLTKSATPANSGNPKYYVPIASGGTSRFGLMMKNAGYDQIVITGRASKPVYLNIVDDLVEIRDARDLWGKADVYQTSDILTARHKGSGVMAIGRSGENQTVFSLAFIDKRSTIGRNGGATVMGAKNLKAVVIYGSKGIRVAEPRRLLHLSRQTTAEALKQTTFLNAVLPAMKLPSSALPSYVELTEMRACASCPTPCRTIYTVNSGPFAGTELRSGYWILVPRYTQYLELKEYTQTAKLIEMFNNAGTCFMTALAMIKFITVLYRDGIIGKADTDGLDLKVGDFASYLSLAEKLLNREGIGDIMARGWPALSEALGADEGASLHGRGVIKGTSIIPGVEGRRMGLLFSTLVNPRAMHLHPIAYYLGKSMDEFREWSRDLGMTEKDIDRIIYDDDFDCGCFTKHYEEGEAIYWAMGVCVFGIMLCYQSIRSLAEYYSAATGSPITPQELKLAGERIWNVYKMLNVREGFTRADDRIPPLWGKSLETPIKGFVFGEFQLTDYFGRNLKPAAVDRMIDSYYEEHGWDIKTGVPTREKLAELGLADLT